MPTLTVYEAPPGTPEYNPAIGKTTPAFAGHMYFTISDGDTSLSYGFAPAQAYANKLPPFAPGQVYGSDLENYKTFGCILEAALAGDVIHQYHLEAGIAVFHIPN